MPFTAVTKIRFGDVDYAQILYYPRFFYLFHLAIEDFFDYLGIPYAQVLTVDKIGFPAVRAEADYFSPLRFGDVVGITIGIERIGHKSAVFTYEVRKQDEQQLCSRGRVTVVAVQIETMQGLPIPEKYRELFVRYMKDPEAFCSQSRAESMGLQD